MHVRLSPTRGQIWGFPLMGVTQLQLGGMGSIHGAGTVERAALKTQAVVRDHQAQHVRSARLACTSHAKMPPDPKTPNTQKHKENQDIHKGVSRWRRPTPLWTEAASLIFLKFLCILGLGVEFAYKRSAYNFWVTCPGIICRFLYAPKASVPRV